MNQFLTSKQTCEQFSISRSTLKKWRIGLGPISPILIEGAHWYRIDGKDCRFNSQLIEDFLLNQNNPTAHQRAIENYLRSLPSSQS
jgi:hypothetical protein